MRYVGAIVFLFVCSALVAQEEVQREKTFGEPVLFETHYIKNDKDSITVEALFRIREDIFVFSRPVESVTTKFSARG